MTCSNFIISLTTVAVFFSATILVQGMKLNEKCMEKTGATEAGIMKNFEKLIENEDVSWPQEFLCYWRCQSLDRGVLKEDGTVDSKSVRETMDRSNKDLMSLIDCMEHNGPYPDCDSLSKTLNCSRTYVKAAMSGADY